MELPFVTCVCVTGDPWRLEHTFPQAVQAFHDQTYPTTRRELIAIYDFGRVANKIDLSAMDALEKKLGYMGFCGTGPLGRLRNVGLTAAKGDFVAQWDDDDWHGKDRLTQQVAAILADGIMRPCCLKRQLCYDLPTDTAFVREYDHTCMHGTIVHPRTNLRYPPLTSGEDTAFLSLWRDSVVVLDNDPALHVRFSHGHNTCSQAHILRQYGGAWARGGWWLAEGHRDYLRSVLSRYPLSITDQTDRTE